MDVVNSMPCLAQGRHQPAGIGDRHGLVEDGMVGIAGDQGRRRAGAGLRNLRDRRDVVGPGIGRDIAVERLPASRQGRLNQSTIAAGPNQTTRPAAALIHS